MIFYLINANLPLNLHPFILGFEREKVGVFHIFSLLLLQTLPLCQIFEPQIHLIYDRCKFILPYSPLHFQGLKERKFVFLEFLLYLRSKLFQHAKLHDPGMIRSTRQVLMTCQSVSERVSAKICHFLKSISQNLFELLYLIEIPYSLQDGLHNYIYIISSMYPNGFGAARG